MDDEVDDKTMMMIIMRSLKQERRIFLIICFNASSLPSNSFRWYDGMISENYRSLLDILRSKVSQIRSLNNSWSSPRARSTFVPPCVLILKSCSAPTEMYDAASLADIAYAWTNLDLRWIIVRLCALSSVFLSSLDITPNMVL
jgi:hypothetical protein